MENLVENNKLIAAFMGSQYKNEPYIDKEGVTQDFWSWSKPESGYPKSVGIGELSTAWMIGNFYFHDSWDWLIPVVEKIEFDLTSDFIYEENHKCVLFKEMHDGSIVVEIQKTGNRISDVYELVIEFIKWYNRQKS